MIHGLTIKRTVLGALIGISVAFVIAWRLMQLPLQDVLHARTEFGILEQVTSYLWLIPIGFGLGLGIVRRELGCFLIAAVCFLLLCRELDLHKLYTLESVSSTRYWRSSEVPHLQKLVIGIGLIFFAYAAFRLFKEGLSPILRATRQGESWVAAFFGGIILAGIPVILDNILDMHDLENRKVLLGSLLEESSEMLVPVFLGVAFWLWGKKRLSS